jgi:hypothetical protein
MRLNFYKTFLFCLLSLSLSLGISGAYAQSGGGTPAGSDNDAAAVEGAGTEGSGNNSHLLLEDDTRVFPNPTSGKMKIQLPREGIKVRNVEIYNTIGRRIYSDYFWEYDGRTIRFNLEQLNSGIYFIRFRADGKTQMHRIVVK